MNFFNFKKNQKGQMLVEILVAVVVAGIVIGGVAGVIGVSLVTSKKTKQVTVANGLAQQDIEAIKTVAQSSWVDLYCPPSGVCPGDKGTTSTYSVILNGSAWEFQSGLATSTIDGLSFGHYFYVENVNRDEGGDIVTSGGSEDPSTQKVTVYITWSGGGSEFSLSEYIMRSGSNYFIDRGWTEGNLNDGPYTRSVGTYSTSSGDINIENGVLEVE
jgi:type II secretory pathway pseudopilin PulG